MYAYVAVFRERERERESARLISFIPLNHN